MAKGATPKDTKVGPLSWPKDLKGSQPSFPGIELDSEYDGDLDDSGATILLSKEIPETFENNYFDPDADEDCIAVKTSWNLEDLEATGPPSDYGNNDLMDDNHAELFDESFEKWSQPPIQKRDGTHLASESDHDGNMTASISDPRDGNYSDMARRLESEESEDADSLFVSAVKAPKVKKNTISAIPQNAGSNAKKRSATHLDEEGSGVDEHGGKLSKVQRTKSVAMVSKGKTGSRPMASSSAQRKPQANNTDTTGSIELVNPPATSVMQTKEMRESGMSWKEIIDELNDEAAAQGDSVHTHSSIYSALVRQGVQYDAATSQGTDSKNSLLSCRKKRVVKSRGFDEPRFTAKRDQALREAFKKVQDDMWEDLKYEFEESTGVKYTLEALKSRLQELGEL